MYVLGILPRLQNVMKIVDSRCVCMKQWNVKLKHIFNEKLLISTGKVTGYTKFLLSCADYKFAFVTLGLLMYPMSYIYIQVPTTYYICMKWYFYRWSPAQCKKSLLNPLYSLARSKIRVKKLCSTMVPYWNCDYFLLVSLMKKDKKNQLLSSV